MCNWLYRISFVSYQWYLVFYNIQWHAIISSGIVLWYVETKINNIWLLKKPICQSVMGVKKCIIYSLWHADGEGGNGLISIGLSQHYRSFDSNFGHWSREILRSVGMNSLNAISIWLTRCSIWPVLYVCVWGGGGGHSVQNRIEVRGGQYAESGVGSGSWKKIANISYYWKY